MTITRTIQSPDGTEITESISLFGAIIKVHFWAYRGVCNQIENVAGSIFNRFIAPPLSFGLNQARRVTVVDYCYTTSLRAVNHLGEKLLHEEIISEDNRKTLKQKEREQQIIQFREQLGDETIYPRFCNVTASYINEIIPKIIAEKLGSLPEFAEGLALYRLGLTIRYINYQLNKRTGYRDAAISSLFGQRVTAKYNGLRSHAADFLVGKHNLEPLLSFEHLLLNICAKLKAESGKDNLSVHLIKRAVRSLGQSLKMQPHIEHFIEKLLLDSPQERFIARLEWHKRNNSLPKGLPNPATTALTPSNLDEELDKALTERINGLVRNLLNNVAPDSLKRGFLGIIYFLEGKDFLVQLLGYLISEFAVKQLVDPHLFALAILYASGEEVADFELDGFGRNKLGQVVFVGQNMMKESLKPGASWESIKKIYDSSQLKAAAGGFEGLMQKKEAKEKLRQFIAQLLYQMVKGEDLQYDSLLKGVRERASQLPVVGMATITLHGLINGMFFSFGYLFRDEKQTDTSFLSWMAKNFSGKGLCNFLADRVVDLIYHPNWRITLLQMIDDLEEVVMNPPPINAPQQAPYSDVDLKPITDFLFQHFVQDSQIPFEGNITPLMHYFTHEGLKEQFKQLLKPSNDSLLEKALTALLPTMKELKLYCRVVDAFRKDQVWLEGGQKFWEVFVRVSLNRLTASRIMELKGPRANVCLAEQAAIRNQFVEHMLTLEKAELRAFLSDVPECSEMLHHWEQLDVDRPEIRIIEPTIAQFSDLIIDDYVGSSKRQ